MKVITCLVLMIWPLLSYSQKFENKLFIPPLTTGPEFSLTLKKNQTTFIEGVESETYGYNSLSYMGPTLEFQCGDSVEFDILNASTEDTITVHWHGFQIPARWDGGPMSKILPGDHWFPKFEVKGLASTKWYHSHMHGITAPQVYKGMAGMIIVRDDIEAVLDLPRDYGIDDIPLIIQDKKFDVDGKLEYAVLGDTMMVNGTLNPYLECGNQVVRLRVLNASVHRVYNLGFKNNNQFFQIGTDGGLLEKSISMNRVVVGNGERVELLLNLSNKQPGDELILMSYSSEFKGTVGGSCRTGTGCGTGALDGTDFEVMKIKITERTENPVLSVPDNLVSIDFIPVNEVDTMRIKNLNNPLTEEGHFTMDDLHFDMELINDTVILGSTELWRFVNNTPIAHPMHIHDTQFNIFRRINGTTKVSEKGWKDVVMVYPGETVDVIAQFLEYSDAHYTYMVHCHYLNHEDMGMMQQFIVVDTSSQITSVIQPHLRTQSVKIFPNPGNSIVEISLKENLPLSQEVNVCFYSSQGILIFEKKLSTVNSKITLDTHDFKSGAYILKVETGKDIYTGMYLKN